MNSIGNLAKKAGPVWSREFDQLIRAIGECKSKAEEDAIIAREVELLKPRLKDAKADKRFLKEVIVRLMYVEMLGHDASWGHVKALQACSDTNLLTKKVGRIRTISGPLSVPFYPPAACLEHVDLPVGNPQPGCFQHASCCGWCTCVLTVGWHACLQVAYLASGLFLDYKSDLIILVVNTLTQDLKSDNYLVGEPLTRLGSS